MDTIGRTRAQPLNGNFQFNYRAGVVMRHLLAVGCCLLDIETQSFASIQHNVGICVPFWDEVWLPPTSFVFPPDL